MEPLIIDPRTVPLGDPDGLQVERVLPTREVSLIGGWCFLDHFGPDDVEMRVAPHPHTGLQTVSWLFAGEIRHRDTLGSDVVVRPGDVNLMTSGRAITHTEYSEGAGPLHGVQLWTALPDAHRFDAPRFEHFAPEPVRLGDHEVAVFVGELEGWDSPVRVYSPMVGAEVRFGSAEPLTLETDPTWQYGVLADSGTVLVDGHPVASGHLAYLPPGRRDLTLAAPDAEGTVVRAILIGGEPLGEEVLMWWTFVGRSHDEIVAWRAANQAAIGAEQGGEAAMFTPLTVRTDDEPEIPAPPLPPGRLRPRAGNVR